MKTPITGLMLLMFIAQAYSQPETVTVETKINQVTVFLRGAQVERSGKKVINAGTTHLKFDNLSPNIDPSSIQIKGEGQLTILSVTHQMNYLKYRRKPPRMLMLEDSIKMLEMKLAMNNNRIEAFKEEKSLILSNKSVKGNDSGLDVEELEYVADFFRERLPEIMQKILEIRSGEKDIREQLSKTRKQLNELNAKWSKSTSEIIVEVSANTRTTGRFTVSFLVHNAGWTPSYDLRALDIKSPVLLNYKAKVFQNTGVNWKKVKLILSTGNPSLSGRKPNLVPWVLSFNAPYQPASYRMDNVAMELDEEVEAMPRVAKAVAKKGKITTTAQFTQLVEGQVNTEFIIEIPYNIPSDNKKHVVEIQHVELPAEFSYYSAPKVDLDAFLLGKVTGWDEYNLLSGEANIYFEGTYIGKSYINVKLTSDTLDLSFGRDKNVIITRKKIKDFTKKKIIGSSKKETIGIEITVRNKKSAPIDIDLQDQIPISSNKEIEVELIDRAGAKLDETSGYLNWEIHLEPSQSKKFVFKYSVKYPKNKTIYNF